jgi:hypothetical protein
MHKVAKKSKTAQYSNVGAGLLKQLKKIFPQLHKPDLQQFKRPRQILV